MNCAIFVNYPVKFCFFFTIIRLNSVVFFSIICQTSITFVNNPPKFCHLCQLSAKILPLFSIIRQNSATFLNYPPEFFRFSQLSAQILPLFSIIRQNSATFLNYPPKVCHFFQMSTKILPPLSIICTNIWSKMHSQPHQHHNHHTTLIHCRLNFRIVYFNLIILFCFFFRVSHFILSLFVDC